jgi:hypothetical protein
MPRPRDVDTIFFGSNPPKHRFVTRNGEMAWYDVNNETLHLTPDDLTWGTYTVGGLLHTMCARYCSPKRERHTQPCPAFVASHHVGTTSQQLATVELRDLPAWEECEGVLRLLDACDTDYERAFLLAYINDGYSDELDWREGLVSSWNEHWSQVGTGGFGRRVKFDAMIWRTLRYPALIPQVWLNWVSGAPDQLHRRIDTSPSRVDFVAYHNHDRHIVEIDGPTHWAQHDGRGYVPDEKAYRRTLVLQRSLRKEGWCITPIARLEVQEAIEAVEDFLPWFGPLSVLPFHDADYPEQPDLHDLGVPELAQIIADDEIPF